MTLLQSMESIENGVSERPWEWDGFTQGSYLGDTLITLGDTYENCQEDMRFIAFARNSWPAIVKVVRAAQAYIDASDDLLPVHPYSPVFEIRYQNRENALAALRAALAEMEGR